jgi:hypothetical protein
MLSASESALSVFCRTRVGLPLSILEMVETSILGFVASLNSTCVQRFFVRASTSAFPSKIAIANLRSHFCTHKVKNRRCLVHFNAYLVGK